MVDKTLVLENRRAIWSARGRCSTLEPKEATRSFMMVLLLMDLSFILVSSKGCRLQHKDSKLPVSDIVPQLSVSSLCTAATTKEQ
jgi:hypothetical protein